MESILCVRKLGFSELSNDEKMLIEAGGPVAGVVTGLIAVAAIALTIACPPAVITGYITVTVVAEVGISILGTVSAWNS